MDQDKLNAFLGTFVGDLGATMAAGSVVIGERLGLYRALAAKPQTPQELADTTGTDARYVEEWLRGQPPGVTSTTPTAPTRCPRSRRSR
jgi:hypothetical protein